jgi:hypothetical protein
MPDPAFPFIALCPGDYKCENGLYHQVMDSLEDICPGKLSDEEQLHWTLSK